jgi:acyl-coenzyme A thioesterase PaaI-like protein
MEADTATSVRGSFTVTEHHQGAPGLAHGGVISAAVDEGMGYLLWLVESPAVTAHIEVNFRRPVPVGARLELEARLEGVRGRKIRASLTGWVDGEIAVDAKALYLKVGVEHFVPHAERMGQRMAERPYNP